MSERETMELFEQFRNDSRLKEALQKTGLPDSPEETVTCLAGLAEELGYALSKETIHEALDELETQRKAHTEEKAEKIKRLSDDDIAEAAGGYSCMGGLTDYCDAKEQKETCYDTFLSQENCWQSDGCDHNSIHYDTYVCWGNLKDNYCELKSDINCNSFLF